MFLKEFVNFLKEINTRADRPTQWKSMKIDGNPRTINENQCPGGQPNLWTLMKIVEIHEIHARADRPNQ